MSAKTLRGKKNLREAAAPDIPPALEGSTNPQKRPRLEELLTPHSSATVALESAEVDTICARTQEFFLNLSPHQLNLLVQDRTCLKCKHEITDHPDGNLARIATSTTAPITPAPDAIDTAGGQAHTILGIASADSGPCPPLRMFYRGFWGSETVVPITFENPMTRPLHDYMMAKSDYKNSRDWPNIFRKTTSAAAVEVSSRLTAMTGSNITSMKFNISDRGVMPLVDVVDFLSDLGTSLLERHLHVVREEIRSRQMHREFMVPRAQEITAREHLIMRILEAERGVGLSGSSLPLRMPASWEVPSFWGAMWCCLSPQLRARYWEDMARMLIGTALTAMTRPGMGMYVPRSEWETRFRSTSFRQGRFHTKANPPSTSVEAGFDERQQRTFGGRGRGNWAPGRGGGRGRGRTGRFGGRGHTYRGLPADADDHANDKL